MADENNLNINDQNISKAQDIANAFGEIQSATAKANKALKEQKQMLIDYGGLYKGIKTSANAVADIQKEAAISSKATGKALTEQDKNLTKVKKLNIEINKLYDRAATLTEDAKDAVLDQARNLTAARDSAQDLADIYGDIADDAAKLDQRTAFFNGISQVVEDIPGLRKLAGPFQDAAKAARQAVIANETNTKKVSVLGAGMKGLAKSASSSAMNFLKTGGYIGIIVKLLKFGLDLFIGAEKNTVAIANNLAISKDQAELLRQNFVKTAKASGKVYVTSVKLIEAQGELVNQLERGGTFSEKTLLAQTFLTKRLNMNASSAAAVTSRFEAFGKNADKGVNSIIDLNNNLIKSGENTATINQIMESISQVGGQIAASFGFSNVEIAKGVIQVRRFGLNLSQARTISENLLDFESSLNNELQTELFLGRDINLNRARAFALQGDIADATEEVMKITEGLTLEQQKSPLIMKSLAATIGLSVDELQDALLLEKDRGRQMQDRMRREREYVQYVRAIKSDLNLSKKAQEEFISVKYKELKLDDANREQLEKNVSFQQALGESIAKVKDSFTGLVNSGVITKLTDKLVNFLEQVAQVGLVRALFGFGPTANTYVNAPNYTPAASYSDKPITTPQNKLATGGIVTKPTRALVGEAGAEAVVPLNEFYAKMDELISVVKAGGDVYIDGNKAGQAMVMSSYRLG